MARQLKDHTILELTEVAYLLGFEDANSFFRAFQRGEGVSPNRWRCREVSRPEAEKGAGRHYKTRGSRPLKKTPTEK